MKHDTESINLPVASATGTIPTLNADRIRMILKRFAGFSPCEIALLSFASLHPDTRGAWLLRLLIEHPGRKHSALLLSAILNGHCTPDCLCLPANTDPQGAFSPVVIDPSWGTFESPIPAADLTTLRTVKTRLRYLDARLKHQRGSSQNPLAQERRVLKHYLRQISTSGGNPRNFPGTYHRACSTLSRSLQRFLAILEQAEPSLAGYAREHLCQGMRFGWKVKEAPHDVEQVHHDRSE